jgi:integrase
VRRPASSSLTRVAPGQLPAGALVQFPASQPDQRNRDRSVARRRYQKGSIEFVRGRWVGRWREDLVLANGTIKRKNRKKVLGTKEDFKTKREAQRTLDLILAPINSLDYRPTHQITFAEFANRWLENVFPIRYKKGGSQATTRRQVSNRLLPVFASIELKDITTEMLQSYVAGLQEKSAGAKHIGNIISTMGAMWKVATAWGYVTHNPFAGLILPACGKPEAQAYSEEETVTIFKAASEPLKTFLWITGECGMRPGEVCGLDAKDIHLDDRIISVRQSESLGLIVTPKSAAGYRDFAISSQLAGHLRRFLNGKTEGLLFVSGNGRPWRESKVVEKRLNPLLKKLGIKRKGLALNGFRHFNATYMDKKNVPVKTRQTRLGHDDPRMTLGMKNRSGYTHMVGEDDRRVAAMFGDMFSRVLCPDASETEGDRAGERASAD